MGRFTWKLAIRTALTVLAVFLATPVVILTVVFVWGTFFAPPLESGVETDLGLIKKVHLTDQVVNNRILLDCDSLYGDGSKLERDFEWDGNAMRFVLENESGDGKYTIQNISTGRFFEKSLKHYPRSLRASLYPYSNNGRSFLFVLTQFGGYSYVSLLSVFNSEGEVVFEEVVERMRGPVLGIGRVLDKDVVTVNEWMGEYPQPDGIPRMYGYCISENNVNKDDFLPVEFGYQIGS